MSVECPYCQHVIKLKGVKAGKYMPKCPKCARGFNLVVSGDEGAYQFAAKPMAEPKNPDSPASAKPASPPAPPEAKPEAPVRSAPPAAPPKPVDRPTPVAAKASPATPKPAPARPPEPAAPPASPRRRETDPGERTELLPFGVTGSDPETTSTELPSEIAGSSASGMDETAIIPPVSGVIDDCTMVGEAAAEPADFDVDAPSEEPDLIPDDERTVPKSLGGYEVQKQLGKGGMGTVLLARQVSLDRPVALKVMNPRWASDPTFVARFTREAYAAAQLVHHNIVQIYDIGAEEGFHFFSMEYIKGSTLADLVREKGKLDVEEAVGYVLQAARGLKFAHDQGMVHRDVKPDNLMLNDQGVVKVADLGLVKTPGAVEAEIQAEKEPENTKKPATLSSLANMTTVGTAMGTPAYMAPEQGRNAADVDARADIYSLGCTLYVMLTGRPPFKGTTALEVMVKHLTEPVIPPETIVKRVPKEISTVLLKMMAKKPEDRYRDMGHVIAALEKFLGVQRTGPFTPSEEHAEALEQSAKTFNNVAAAKLRQRAWPIFWLSCAALTLLFAFISLQWAGGIVGLAALTALLTFLVTGITQKTYLYRRVRGFVLDSDLRDWVTWGIGFLLILALLYVIGLLVYWLFFLVVAGGLAAAYHFLIERPLQAQRAAPLTRAEKVLKGMRLRGVQEDAIRNFVCKYSGDSWEEFFEHLFGYENLVQARKLWTRTDTGKPRHSYAAWRDFLVQWLDARLRAKKEARERRLLQSLEQKKLQAEGMDAVAAKAKATQAAAVMVAQAAEIKDHTIRQGTFSEQATVAQEASLATPVAASAAEVATTDAELPAPAFTASPPPPAPPAINIQTMLKAAEKPEDAAPLRVKPEEEGAGGVFALVFGGHIRFLVGAALLACCFLWMNQNSLIPHGDFTFEIYKIAVSVAQPLKILPEPIDKLFSGFGVGVAGLLLVLSALTNRGKLLAFLLVAAGIAWLGPLVVPDIGSISATYVCIIAALALAEFGLVFERTVRPKKE